MYLFVFFPGLSPKSLQAFELINTRTLAQLVLVFLLRWHGEGGNGRPVSMRRFLPECIINTNLRSWATFSSTAQFGSCIVG